MDPPMKPGPAVAIAALLLLASVATVGALGGADGRIVASAALPASYPTLKGNITGPTVIGYHAEKRFWINGTGGPATLNNGSIVGNVTFYASVTGANTTGVSIVPSEGVITNVSGYATLLTVTNITEVLTIVVELTSVYDKQNVSLNMTYAVNVVEPYTLTLNLLSQTSATILPFTLTVDLDGAPVGTVSVPTMTGKSSYVATFQYATLGLAPGEHTFTVSFANEHGLVTFAGGGTTYSTSFYVPGPAPSYTLWYVAGAVAFFGAIFIFVTRVAARRRAPTKK